MHDYNIDKIRPYLIALSLDLRKYLNHFNTLVRSNEYLRPI